VRECTARYDAGHCSKIDFLYGVSHCADSMLSLLDEDEAVSNLSDDDTDSGSVAAVTTTVTSASSAPTAMCVVCLNAQRQPIALVPCGHSVMCTSCANAIFDNGQHCPMCRSQIIQLLTLFS
jgi:hypothetical protein